MDGIVVKLETLLIIRGTAPEGSLVGNKCVKVLVLDVEYTNSVPDAEYTLALVNPSCFARLISKSHSCGVKKLSISIILGDTERVVIFKGKSVMPLPSRAEPISNPGQ